MVRLKIRANHDPIGNMTYYYKDGVYIGASSILSDGSFFKCTTLKIFCRKHGL